ncbi:protein DpdH [Alteromonas sp. RKMC-009]|uniref:protein DpdH n=1 Tax=Alteromonas sp. RKMC-009 TaxID=2267264 RepID=UPI000E682F75|nr:protein DpdH [Alteromonas sp. RKMC-009]AYA62599.1 hypothetical protein DS731_00460 [Alteromonas sp. RKMC-009]
MGLENYWPARENVLACVKIEAEELSEETLLSVHEPMQLVKFSTSTDEVVATENDLLKHFLQIDRPIPIVADAGLGKSHLVRWLHAKLKTQEIVKEQKWQIVRIPKNASLRQTLHLLLENLDGEIFESARKKIDEVGSSLVAKEVADLFVTFLKHRIEEISVDAQNTMRSIGRDGDPEQLKKLREKASIARALPSLVDDVEFKKYLIHPESYVYKVATRWIKGVSERELELKEFELSIIEFEKIINSFSIDDLSLPSRNAIKALQLDSVEEKRKSALQVINDGIVKATQTTFQQLFQFNNGNFQDVFKEIRRHLKSLDRTLVILVEDLAAVSAIEDVLIDCLLEEAQDDLCTLKSVLAVTGGYTGYTKRQATIRTRARYEWQIRDNNDTQENIQNRIVDFCSRYLNAARHGSKQLNEIVQRNQQADNIDVWSTELDEKQANQLESFGKSSIDIPLFPYNRKSIIRLASWYCRNSSNEIVFNPRDILEDVLLNILRDHREDYIKGLFPLNVEIKERIPSLIEGINQLSLNSPDQAIKLSIIWADVKTVEQLSSSTPKEIAQAFNLEDFAKLLGSNIIIDPAPPPTVPREPKNPINVPDKGSNLEDELLPWFNKQAQISQKYANELRIQLYEMIRKHSPSDWYGFKNSKIFTKVNSKSDVFDFTLKSGQRYLINIPGSSTNERTSNIDFYSEEDFFSGSDTSALAQRTALAILRYRQNNPNDGQKQGWDYPQGFEDYTYYKNFEFQWVPIQIQEIAKTIRKRFLTDAVAKHLALQEGLGLKVKTDILDTFLMTRVHIENSLEKPINENFQEYRSAVLDEWEINQSMWKDLLSISNVAVDRDNFNIALKQARKKVDNQLPGNLRKLQSVVIKELKPVFSQITENLSETENVEELYQILDEILESYKTSEKLGLYPPNTVTYRTAKQYINDLKENLKWNQFKEIIKLQVTSNEKKLLEILSNIDGSMIDNIRKVLIHWSEFNKAINPIMNQRLNSVDEKHIDELSEAVTQSILKIERSLVSLEQHKGDTE